jgi:hypothetical protein
MKRSILRVGWFFTVTCTALAAPAQADVTVQQKTSLDVASMIHMHGATTTSFTTDKKREDTESHCEGMMSLLCGNVQGGEIVRLDRDVTWHLEPDKKRYREQAFATPEEMAEMRAKMQARLEKMRSCPVSQKQQPIDKSKCEMSPPKIDVHKTEDRLSIAGHDAQRTAATLTETCTNKDTGDVCDTVVAVDVWLTQDKLPGSGDRRAFDVAYAKKLGLTDSQGIMQGDAAKFLAPYQSQIKQLTDKSGDFKGQPLKTSLRVLMGGQQCSAATKMQANQSSSGDGSASGSPMANVAQAGKAIGSSVGHLVGGLFHKKKADDSTDAASAAAPADGAADGAGPGSAATGATSAPATANAAPAAAGGAPDPFAQYVQMAAFSMETVMISTDAIPAARFDLPPDWTKEVPKPTKSGDDEYTCPKS